MNVELVNERETNRLLATEHYLGPIRRGFCLGVRDAGRLVAVQVWTLPTSRALPADESWLELARWCLTPAAGKNAGSAMQRRSVRWIRERRPAVTTLVSYSDPSAGHTGALYRASAWYWSPTWHRLRPPPTGNGAWVDGEGQSVKDRWIFDVRPDERRRHLLVIDDPSALRSFDPETEWQRLGVERLRGLA